MAIGLSNRVQLGVEEVEEKDREEQVEVERENESKRARHGWYGDGCETTQDLRQMRCETTSTVKDGALRARSTHGAYHAIVKVNIVIGVVLGEVLVARVVPLVVDTVIGLTPGLIAHVVVVVCVVATLHRIFCIWRYSLHQPSVTVNCCWLLPNFHCNSV